MTTLAQRRGACPALSAPMRTGDGLLVRLNPVAGGLLPQSLIGLCRSAARHGNGIMEVTQRGSIQIRGVTPESARLLADDVNALGIAVRGGVPVETGPLAGIDPDEIADPRPLAQAIRMAVESAGLSRRLGPKVTVIVDGGGSVGMGDLVADVRLTAVEHEGRFLWHCAIGGTAATARPAGLFAEAEACNATIAVLGTIATLGLEGHGRDLNAQQLDLLRSFATGRESGGLAGDRLGVSRINIFPLANSTHALGISLPFGSMPAERIAELARAAAGLGTTEIRPAPGRILFLLGLTIDSAVALRSKAAALGFVTDPADPRLSIVACPGKPACAAGHIETRAIAEQVSRHRSALLDGSLMLHVSGCAKGCARPAVAALTLIGGENRAGLVVNGTAGDTPSVYTVREHSVQALDRIAALVAKERGLGETAGACLARLGAPAIATAFAQEQA